MLLGAFSLSRLLPRLVRRAVRRMLDTRVRQRFAALPRTHRGLSSIPDPHRQFATRSAPRRSARWPSTWTSFTIWVTAAMLILHDLDVALVTLVTGAGFLGVAIALGAQDLLRDYTAGFFMLLDDRFGLGDRVEVGEIVGDRRDEPALDVHPRHAQGTEWYVPNGRLQEVGAFCCPGFDTWGPLRLVGGVNKGRPDDTDLERAAGVRATDAQPRCRSMRRGHDHARKSG